MSSLESLFGSERADWLRARLLAAIKQAYDENCSRYDEALGDNATTFGICLFHNISFLLEQSLNGLADIEVTRPENSFVVRIDHYNLHVYKAPPSIDHIYGLRFDQSAIRLALIDENTQQLRLQFRDGPEGSLQSVASPRHLVAVHFGDPMDGLRHVEIGAPVQSGVAVLSWAWIESLTTTQEAHAASSVMVPPPDPVPDFGLRIIDPSRRDSERQRSA